MIWLNQSLLLAAGVVGAIIAVTWLAFFRNKPKNKFPYDISYWEAVSALPKTPKKKPSYKTSPALPTVKELDKQAHIIEEKVEKRLLEYVNKDSLLDYCQRLTVVANKFRLCQNIIFIYRLDTNDTKLTICNNGKLSKVSLKALSAINDVRIAEHKKKRNIFRIEMFEKEKLINHGIELSDSDLHNGLFEHTKRNLNAFMIVEFDPSLDSEQEKQLIAELSKLYRYFSAAFSYQNTLRALRDKPQTLQPSTAETVKPAHSELDLPTGTWNKRSFIKKLQQEMHSDAKKQACCIVIFDIDNLSRYDQVKNPHLKALLLNYVVKVTRSQLGGADYLARWSDTQFVIYLPGMQHFNALQFAERLRLNCQKKSFVFNKIRYPISLTLSVSSLKASKNIESMLNNAMEQAILNGSNYTVSA